MKKIIALMLFVIFLVGCASTGYERAKKPNKYGYFDNNCQDNVYEVQFRANHYTSTQKANDFNTLRCAELCLEEGYKTFSILSKQNNTEVSSTSHSYGNAYGYGNGAYGYGTSYTETNIYPVYVTIIECFKDTSGYYKAEQIRNNIIKKYNLKKLKIKYNIK